MSPLDRMARIAAAIMREPMTATQVTLDIGVGLSTGSCESTRKALLAYHDLGCIYVLEWERVNSPRYAWQPKPFEISDAPRPVSTYRPRPGSKRRP